MVDSEEKAEIIGGLPAWVYIVIAGVGQALLGLCSLAAVLVARQFRRKHKKKVSQTSVMNDSTSHSPE